MSGLGLQAETARKKETYIFQTWTLPSETKANLDRMTLEQWNKPKHAHSSEETMFLIEQLRESKLNDLLPLRVMAKILVAMPLQASGCPSCTVAIV